MAKPKVTFTVEPMQGDVVTFQLLAPENRHSEVKGQAAFLLKIRNREAAKVILEHIEFNFLLTNSPQPVKWGHPVAIAIEPGGFRFWHNQVHTIPKEVVKQPEDFRLNQNIIIPPTANILKIVLRFRDFDKPVNKMFALRAHQSPTPKNAYAFPAKTKDLRANEFWHGAGANHGESEHGCQLFALDVGVSGWDSKLKTWHHLLPRTGNTVKLETNEDHRVWGKPVYAMADGEVIDARWDFPENSRPSGTLTKSITDLINKVGDGNGNFVKILTGDEVHLYAHFQFDSVPQRLRGGRVRVEKGELLGKVGNSGASSAPHLHFGILKHRRFIAPGDARFILRPMPFTDMHSVKSAEAKIGDANASWFKHTNHGLSQAAWPDRCLIWPAAGKPSL